MFATTAHHLARERQSRAAPAAVCLATALLLALAGAAEAQTPKTARSAILRPEIASPVKGPAHRLGSLEAVVSAVQRHGTVEEHKEIPLAGIKLYHYLADMNFSVPVFRGSRWTILGNVGLGATRLRSNDLPALPGYVGGLSETYLSLLGGLQVEYEVNSGCSVYVGARDYMYVDGNEKKTVTALGGTLAPMRAGTWTLPFTLGIRMRFR